MYTDSMKRAFRSIPAPPRFSVSIIDDEFFLTVLAKEKDFMQLTGEEKVYAVEYMIKVKKALEDNGAVVMLVREGGVSE
jgi:hypothetical protein